jgi:hypothetical protein
MRLYPPVPCIVRTCKEAAEIGGHVIPVGAVAVANVYEMNLDPRFWSDPEEYRSVGSALHECCAGSRSRPRPRRAATVGPRPVV